MNKWLQIGGLHSTKGREFLLDGYLTDGNPKIVNKEGSTYTLQYYQKEHKEEYVVKKDNKVCLFQNGLLGNILPC